MTLTIDIPDRTEEELSEAEREEGRRRDELVVAALDDYLALRKFRRLRAHMVSEISGQLSDEDVFEQIS